MSRTLQVIMVIAIVCTAVEICSLVVNYFEPPKFTDSNYLRNVTERAELRWRIYWFGGLPVALLGLFVLKKYELPGSALLIAGIYLMIFGNNGGFWAAGYVTPRIITSVITFFWLLYLIRNERWVKTI